MNTAASDVIRAAVVAVTTGCKQLLDVAELVDSRDALVKEVGDLAGKKGTLATAFEAERKAVEAERETLVAGRDREMADYAKAKAGAEESIADLARQREALGSRMEELRAQLAEQVEWAKTENDKEQAAHENKLADLKAKCSAAEEKLAGLQAKAKAFHADIAGSISKVAD